jgi:hypothetical protein
MQEQMALYIDHIEWGRRTQRSQGSYKTKTRKTGKFERMVRRIDEDSRIDEERYEKRRKNRRETEESTRNGLMINRGIRRLDATSSHLVKISASWNSEILQSVRVLPF